MDQAGGSSSAGSSADGGGSPSSGGANAAAGSSSNAGSESMPAAGGAGSAAADGGAGGDIFIEQCVPSGDEQCNGRDDDCNGVVDDGCPGSVTTTFQKDLPLLGDSAGGSAFSDDCKDGEVLAGISVAMGAFLSQTRGVCRQLALELSSGSDHGYRVRLTHDRALLPHPASSSDVVTPLACPEDEALVGLRLAQQHYMLGDGTSVPVTTRVWLTCAKLVLSDSAGKLVVTWTGAKEQAPASGSSANGTAWLVSASAPDGLVASRLLGTAGSWIDRVGFGVSALGVGLN